MLNLFILLLLWCCCSLAAQGARSLNDEELAQISGGDGVSMAVHLALNDPASSGGGSENRIAIGTAVDGQTNYIVVRNLRGTIDMFAVNLSVRKKPDGGDYLALGLPGYIRFGGFGFDSLSVQADPSGPVTQSLGRIDINGTLSMQGQLRLWAH
ncbi:MAG TPA: hypothetical protein VEC06_07115 [Paucimonas sp.]|nr:hypothetical protein [Paucimonas sp.]